MTRFGSTRGFSHIPGMLLTDGGHDLLKNLVRHNESSKVRVTPHYDANVKRTCTILCSKSFRVNLKSQLVGVPSFDFGQVIQLSSEEECSIEMWDPMFEGSL